MRWLTADLSCHRCGGDLLGDGYDPVVSAPDLGWIDARCDRCLWVVRVTVSMTAIEPWPVDLLDPDARLARARVGASVGALGDGAPR